ncbi:MAG: ATP-dependent RecD-like DNA helicase [Oscillospiraceae bacterium]|nr:ATP-dependent RecD-like DNA helicase [Oscillospiraceae bacterium]
MEELTTVDGTVHSLIFQNAENGYTVLRLLTVEGEVVTVVGCIPCVAPGEHLTVSGVWEQHPQHGEQLRAVELERSLPEDEEEIMSYLSSGVCKGVGPATAARIVERFGAEALDVLEREPERLATVRGITAKKAQEMSESFRRHMGLRRLMAFLAQYQLPPILAMQLRSQYGDGALEMVRSNPYLLSTDFCGVEFSVTDEIAMSMGFSADCEARLQAAVTFELSHNENNGHVFLPRPKLIAATAQLLGCGESLPEAALDALIARGAVVQEQVANVQACYLKRLWEAEVSACARLNVLLEAEADVSRQAERAVAEIEVAQGITYAPQQRQAVALAARSGVLILTGGPGTGKTTTVRGIMALFQKMGLDIVLAAPTGRAAKRMSELTGGMEAQTIHRLLGMNWNESTHQVTFAKTEKEPLEADAVIVDEMSMVDLPLFSALLRALRPGTRLVLVGDADQLPSVGAGNVFSDLIRSGQVETVFLRQVFRQAEQSAIIRNAHAVNLGEPPRLTNDQEDFFFLCRREAQRAVSTVVELCKSRLPGKMGFPADQIQVLTPTRKGPSGTIHLNRLLQEALNPPAPGKRQLQWGERLFREGDRIMQTRNNYDVVWEKEDGTVGVGMFNGDVGRILQIDDGGEWLTVDFDGRSALYSVEMLSEIDLAYAQTVHKAQGSEYRCVVLCAMPAAQSLMVRGVLYTAITRARELLVVVGDDAVLRTMAENDRRQRRYSGLRWRLAHSGKETP